MKHRYVIDKTVGEPMDEYFHIEPAGVPTVAVQYRQARRVWTWPSLRFTWCAEAKFLRVSFFLWRTRIWRFGYGRTEQGRWFQWGGKPEGQAPQLPWGRTIADA